MGDGWETRRSRGKNFDWLIIKCAAPAKIGKIQIDTHHFKGNYPDKCSIQAAYIGKKISAGKIINKSKNWKLLLSKSKLNAFFINKVKFGQEGATFGIGFALAGKALPIGAKYGLYKPGAFALGIGAKAVDKGKVQWNGLDTAWDATWCPR